jgi:hypothetical protein
MADCGASKPLLYDMTAVCTRVVGHGDEVTVPGRDGPELLPANQHYDANIVGAWPQEEDQ